MAKNVTYLKDECGVCANCACGENFAVDEYYGMCETCWIALSAEERAVLRGEEPPVREIVEHRTEVYRVNPPNRPAIVLGWIWRLSVTAALAYLLYWRRA